MSIPEPDVLLAHGGFIRAVARGLLDADRAEDVVQESYLAALRRPPDQARARGWFGAVARNLALMRRRGDGRRAQRERASARPEAEPATADTVARLEVQRRVVEAVTALREPYRTAIVRRYFDGLAYSEMGVPAETARTRVKRGLDMLRSRLDTDYHGDRKAWTALLLPLLPLRTATLTGAVAVSTKTKLAIGAALVLLLALWVSQRETARDANATRAERPPERAAADAPPPDADPA
ncbi:MAG: RNA polymerase sigma factor, partial [Planctomycetota bacterium]|nr:RNA polymerase sigma factor [Planctomycetota bacterium]